MADDQHAPTGNSALETECGASAAPVGWHSAPGLAAMTSLERAAALRGDAAAMQRLRTTASARCLLIADGRLVIDATADRSRASLRRQRIDQLAAIAIPPQRASLIGVDAAGAALFAIALSPGEATRAAAAGLSLAPAVDIRSLMTQGVLTADEAAIAATALALTHWQHDTRFCGRCGNPMGLKDAGWRRRCDSCERDTFPRTDPVVIMLVTHGERCALARQKRFPDGMWSAIAGFVEPGETIEAAVARETTEELGLEVGSIAYRMSQPWPMPHSLMIGCRCVAEAADITIDPAEIAEARWFGRDEIALMLAGQHPAGLWVPGQHAIAHWLIREFLERPAG